MKTVIYVLFSLISLSVAAASASDLSSRILTDQLVIEEEFQINIEPTSFECFSESGRGQQELGYCLVQGDLKAPNSSCDFMISVREFSYNVLMLQCEE
ncbi:hypothetical protein M902_0603 [Bacteriovorax sp. BAL6_X]|uniref:hypothetical protein n=1 Tax=Bacteriovorax sp. BAL6_X TaxID=1201290 RepID=UPI000385AF45|nr:hypothetical protein [Bacteriovorax sp. BAL6_X]EPZ50019.1 hypothetical protein M902_0603 [Bacteriovorax sp. BAL6_X]